MKRFLVAFTILFLCFSSARSTEVIYLAEEILDTLEIVQRFVNHVDHNATNSVISKDLSEIWAYIDKLAFNLDIVIKPKSELKFGTPSQCQNDRVVIANMLRPVATYEKPLITDIMEALVSVSELFPQAILNCAGSDRLERNFRSYLRYYVNANVKSDNLE